MERIEYVERDINGNVIKGHIQYKGIFEYEMDRGSLLLPREFTLMMKLNTGKMPSTGFLTKRHLELIDKGERIWQKGI